MAVRVHHLNCGTMRPGPARLVSGVGGLLERATLVCHCLLVETARGLLLVDTGFGLEDVRAPARRLGRGFVGMVRPLLALEETAARQVERLGFRRDDVRWIFLTHLDPDHAGGLADFPTAEVHVLEDEFQAATNPRTAVERARYRREQWRHGPRWVRHRPGGDRWLGFQAVQALDEREPDVRIVPLFGHTRGHAAVAVQAASGWELHAGDAYFHRDEMLDPPRCPVGLALYQRIDDVDTRERKENQARLRQLARECGSEVRMFSAHDPVEFARVRAQSAAAVA